MGTTGSQKQNLNFENKIFVFFQFYTSEHLAPGTICTTCSFKLKNAFEYREHLIKMNEHWETLMKNNPVPNTLDDEKPQEPELNQIQPKLEVVVFDDPSEYTEFEAIEEYLDEELTDEDILGPDEDIMGPDEDVKRSNESDEDEKFIQTAMDFIKTVKPTEPKKKQNLPRPSGRLITARTAKKLVADTERLERLNFRSTLSPHSSQKLKKANKWWRMMHDCNYCDAKDFLTADAVKKHLRLHHADVVKVTCEICQKDYSEVCAFVHLFR